MDSLCFTSPLFKIEVDEDKKTNPRRYGMQLAAWLRNGLLEMGYEVEDPIAEDWGWCVMCQREPFMLWVGCGNVESRGPEIDHRNIVWMCFVVAETPLLKRLFGKVNTAHAEAKLQGDLIRILEAESEIRIVECP